MAPGLLALLLLLPVCPSLGAQEWLDDLPLPLKREVPPPPEGPCELRPPAAVPPRAATDEERTEAGRLASEASRAAILGDREEALSLLREAAELDPGASEIAYRLGRFLQDAGDGEGALDEFCRFLELEEEGLQTAEVRDRVEQIAPRDEDPLTQTGRAAFQEGIDAFDAGDYDEAGRHFSRALVENPGWDDAHYNRGVSYLRAGRTGAGAADLEWYLETSPTPPDRTVVEAVLEELAPTLEPRYSPRTTLTAGLVLPGMGHFYSGRPGPGVLVLTAAGTGAAVGILHRKVEVDCLTVPRNGECPPGEVLERRVDRPLLVPGLLTAAGVTVLGAIHAFRQVRGAEAERQSDEGELEVLPSVLRMGRVRPSLTLDAAPLWKGGGARATLELHF